MNKLIIIDIIQNVKEKLSLKTLLRVCILMSSQETPMLLVTESPSVRPCDMLTVSHVENKFSNKTRIRNQNLGKLTR